MTDLGLLALGLAVYGALFAFVGAFFKRPLLIGLMFTFGWEPTVMVLPGYLKQFTIAYYLQSLVPHAMPSEGLTSLLQGFFRETPVPGDVTVLAGGLRRRLSLAGHPCGRAPGVCARAVEPGWAARSCSVRLETDGRCRPNTFKLGRNPRPSRFRNTVQGALSSA